MSIYLLDAQYEDLKRMAKEYGYVKENGEGNPSEFIRDIVQGYYQLKKNLMPTIHGKRFVMNESEWMEWRDTGEPPATAHPLFP